jgi:A/G-specific adenine glycosylase
LRVDRSCLYVECVTTPHQRKISAIVSKLLEWYSKNARDLPWRRTRDSYAIWISEAMLQQTQVATVVPYWERWMRAFPDVQALAAAAPAKVLKLWEGLGYYARARNLHRAAQCLVQTQKGRLPMDLEGWLALPGIGRYTAGAICSIAFNQPVPILDGNVTRVLCRIYGIRTDPRAKETNQLLWQRAAELVEAARDCKSPGTLKCSHLNQSLMELGALICTPRQPQCGQCPVQRICVAFRSGLTEAIPSPKSRVKTVHKSLVCWIIEHEGLVLACQRPGKGVNARLWEFPGADCASTRMDQALAIAEKILGFRLENGHRVGVIQHSITNHRYAMNVFRGTASHAPPFKDTSMQWLTVAQVHSYPFAAAHRKAAKWLHSDL